MTRSGAAVAALALVLAGCSQSDQEKARERAAEARRKAREEAHELAHDAKRAANALDRDINQAVNGGPGASGGGSMHAAGDGARIKLDRAALIAKVKAKLATDVGLSTVTGIEVDDSARVVTLRGTVDSLEQKQQAEHAVRQVDGVRDVVNDLQVKP